MAERTFVIAGNCDEFRWYTWATMQRDAICVHGPDSLLGVDPRNARLVLVGSFRRQEWFREAVDYWRERGGEWPDVVEERDPRTGRAIAERARFGQEELTRAQYERAYGAMRRAVVEGTVPMPRLMRYREPFDVVLPCDCPNCQRSLGAFGKSKQLLRSILPEKEREELDRNSTVTVEGKTGYVYEINTGGQTRIFRDRNGPQVAQACLQLTIDAPPYDRMSAEYMLLRNDEPFYLRTANIQAVELGMVLGMVQMAPLWPRLRRFLGT